MMNAGEIATRLGLSGIPRGRRGDDDRARSASRRDDRRPLSRRPMSRPPRRSRRSARAKARGLPVTCDTAPPYFALNEIAVGDYRTFAKLSPPLRSEDDRRAVVAAWPTARSTASPATTRPRTRNPSACPSPRPRPAIIGLETLLPLIARALSQWRAAAARPAAPRDQRRRPISSGLPQGRLAKGAPADLVLFDLDRPGRIEVDRLPQQIEELALRRPPGPGPRACAPSSTGAPSSRRTA